MVLSMVLAVPLSWFLSETLADNTWLLLFRWGCRGLWLLGGSGSFGPYGCSGGLVLSCTLAAPIL